MKADSVRTIFYALGANLAIAVAKTGAAITTGSSAMLAEAIHSYADAATRGLLLWGMKQAKRPPSADYPLGWGKAVFFWSFIVALVLFSLGGLFSLYEGWHKLAHPEDLELSRGWRSASWCSASSPRPSRCAPACRRSTRCAAERTLWRWFRESRQSELVVILGEDIAALLGLAFALVAILITMLTGNPVWDALGSMSIGVLLIVVAIGIGIEIKALLIGQSAEPETVERMREFLAAAGRRGKDLSHDHDAARHLADGRGKGEDESRQRRRAGGGDQPRRGGAARRVSRDPVAVLRARHRGLNPRR